MADVFKEIDTLADQYKKMFGEYPAYLMLPNDQQVWLTLLRRALETKTPIQYPAIPDDAQF